MKLRLITAAGLAVLMALSAAGCGNKGQESDAQSSLISGDVALGSSKSSSEQKPKPDAKPTSAYTELLEAKQEVLPVVATRVTEYRTGKHRTGSKYAEWQDGYLDAAMLPLIVSDAQFAVRQDDTSGAQAPVYLAVRMDDDNELRIAVEKSINEDENPDWVVVDSWFAQSGYGTFDSWALTDTDIYTWSDEDIYQLALCTYGAEEVLEDGKKILKPLAVSLFYDSEGWGEQGLPPKLAYSWFFASINWEDYDYKRQVYKHPKGEDMGWFYPPELYEMRVQRYFDVTTEQLRSDPTYYDEALGGYCVGGGGGRGETPPILLTKTEKDGDLHKLWYTMSQSGADPISMVMTIRIEQDGRFRYVSVLPAQ